MTVAFMVLSMLCISNVSAYESATHGSTVEAGQWDWLKDIFSSHTFSFITCPAGYDYCWTDSYSEPNTGTLATASVYITDPRIYGHISLPYITGEAAILADYSGDKFYLAENYATWDSIMSSCNSDGCAGLQEISAGKHTLVSGIGNTYDGCPAFVAWDKDIDSATGKYSWVATGYGWIGSGGCFDYRVVECVNDFGCAAPSTCNLATRTCEAVQAPLKMFIDMDREYTFDDTNDRVLQYFEEFDAWYIYDNSNPDGSTLIVSAAQWLEISTPEGFIFDINKEYTYVPPDAVWQYNAETDIWYIYRHELPDMSSMILTAEQWAQVLEDNKVPEPDTPAPSGLSVLIIDLIDWIKAMFQQFFFMSILGETEVTPGETVNYVIDISTVAPDHNLTGCLPTALEHCVYQTQYAYWGLIDSDRNILGGQVDGVEVDGRYATVATVTIPQAFDNYIIVATIEQIDSTYSFDTRTWTHGEAYVVVKEALDLTAAAPEIIKPAPTGLSLMLTNLISWLKGLFDWL